MVNSHQNYSDLFGADDILDHRTIVNEAVIGRNPSASRL